MSMIWWGVVDSSVVEGLAVPIFMYLYIHGHKLKQSELNVIAIILL